MARAVDLSCTLLVFEKQRHREHQMAMRSSVKRQRPRALPCIRNNTLLFASDPTSAPEPDNRVRAARNAAEGARNLRAESNVIGFRDNYGIRAALRRTMSH